MIKTLSINGIEIAIQKKKIKNMHLHVRPDGSVYMSVPYRTSEQAALQFARANVSWIQSQLAVYAEKPGKEYYLSRKEELDRRIAELLPYWEQQTGLACSSWHSRYMTSRWGSCIPSKGRICFNLQLADKPQECLEYVILHELLHLRHPGHGAEFKMDLSRYMPDWRDCSKRLES